MKKCKQLSSLIVAAPQSLPAGKLRLLVEYSTDIDNTFQPIIDTLESGPPYLANTLETIRLCAAFVESHKTSFRDQK